MNPQTKILTLSIITILLMTSVLMFIVEPVNAQKPSPPSVPQFSVKLVAHPYDVPPTTSASFNTSTWTETTTTVPGYQVENRSIEVTIKNQPFTPYILSTSDRNYSINLYYTVEIKERYSENWRVFRYSIFSYTYQVQSNSEYTVVTGSADYPDNTQLDFRVQAIIGQRYSATADSLAGMYLGPVDSMLLSAESAWSDIQTLKVTNGAVSSSTPNSSTATTNNAPLPSSPVYATAVIPVNPTATSSTGEYKNSIDLTLKNYPTTLMILIGAVVLLAGLIAVLTVLLLFKKQQKTSNSQNNDTLEPITNYIIVY